MVLKEVISDTALKNLTGSVWLMISVCVCVFTQDNGRIGDEFMKQIQSIAAYTPYMTCPGNHEWAL